MARIYGIDLGTTNSLIAVMDGEAARVLADPKTGAAILPSVVAIAPEGEVYVGDEAIAVEPRLALKNDGVIHATGFSGGDLGAVIRSVKRYMGLGSGEIAPEDQARYTFADLTGPVARFQVGKRAYTPSQISAEILRALKDRAEVAMPGEKVERVVITVPAYFNDGQRQATKDAGRLAGLEVVRLVNEPTAASLAYGLQKLAEGRVAVYDFGGGTFDISILNVKGGVFEVLSTNGDTHLGGDDIDGAIVNWFLADLPESIRNERHIWNSARRLAEDAKQKLSSVEETELILEIPPDLSLREKLTRAHLEEIAKPLIDRTLERCRLALKDAKLDASQIDAIVLVGGSTRMPMVRREVAKMFGREPLCSINPDEVVALGAAVQASVLMGTQHDMLLLDVVPLSLGIETVGGVMERIIHRNTTIPTSVTEMFTTAVDNQTHVDVHVLQGEREMAKDSRSLARFKLGPLEGQPAGYPKIAVTFLIDANGILNVTARDGTGREHSIDIKPSYGLTDDEIEKMLEEAMDLGEQDLEERLLIVARNDAHQILTALQKQFAEWGHLVEADERGAIEEMVRRLEVAEKGTDREQIAKLVEDLNTATTPFAERIMDAAIKQALEKKSVEELA